MKSVCNQCANEAIFSKRITDSTEQYLPDENAYIPLCRNCFYII
jgi:thymidine kinase